MNEKTLRSKADEMSGCLLSSKNNVALLISGNGGFERYHKTHGNKVWDGSGNKLISVSEAIFRALLGYFDKADINTLTAAWLVEYDSVFTEKIRFGKREFTQEIEHGT